MRHILEKTQQWPRHEEAPGEPIHVLVIDDDPVFCRVMAKMCQKDGVIVHVWAPTADWENSPDGGLFDVVLMDYNIGDINGLQLAYLYQDTPTVLVSAGKQEALSGSWPQSVVDFIPKRRGFQHILEAVRAAALLQF